MADETMLLDPQAVQEKQRKEGVKGEAKPTRKEEAKDAATPPAKKTSQTKTASVLFGIPQLGLTHVDREVPAQEPPPLAANAELKYVGHQIGRASCRERVWIA